MNMINTLFWWTGALFWLCVVLALLWQSLKWYIYYKENKKHLLFVAQAVDETSFREEIRCGMTVAICAIDGFGREGAAFHLKFKRDVTVDSFQSFRDVLLTSSSYDGVLIGCQEDVAYDGARLNHLRPGCFIWVPRADLKRLTDIRKMHLKQD